MRDIKGQFQLKTAHSYLIPVSSAINKCPHCKSVQLGKPYEEIMYENGIDDPQYGGELISVSMRDCMECGELGAVVIADTERKHEGRRSTKGG